MLDDLDKGDEVDLVDLFEVGVFGEGASFVELDQLVVFPRILQVVLDSLGNQVLLGLDQDLVVDVNTDQVGHRETSLHFHQ